MSDLQAGKPQPPFTPERRRILGLAYGFLIELGQKRLQRMEKKASNSNVVANNRQDYDQLIETEDLDHGVE